MKHSFLFALFLRLLFLTSFRTYAEEAAPPIVNEVMHTIATLQTLFATEVPASLRSQLLTATANSFDAGSYHTDENSLRIMLEAREGTARSVGIVPEMSELGVIVKQIAPESGAAKLGVKEGLRIVRINGVNVSTLSFAAVCLALERTEAESVTLVCEDEKRTSQSFTVPTSATILPAIARRENFAEDLAYLRLNGLYADSGKTISEHLKASAHKPGIIIDLRDSSGADSASVREIASLFAPDDASLFAFYDTQGNLIAPERSTSDVKINAPVMVLISGKTTGASELLAATLSRSTRGAMVLGSPTAGDPLLRSPVPVPGGGALWIATRVVRFADGSVFKAGTGLDPDVVVSPTLDAAASTVAFTASQTPGSTEDASKLLLSRRVVNDAALQRAVDILLGLKALNVRSIGLRTPPP